VVFTSGATESNHLAIRGVCESFDGGSLVSSGIEHPCVLGAIDAMAQCGFVIYRWAIGSDGVVGVTQVPDDTRCVSLMAANHETGVIQPLRRAHVEALRVGAWLHVDATQAVGRMHLPLDGVHSVALSSHKLGGPPGIGALLLPDGESFPALFQGSQERGRRGGTVPTALAVGFGVACAPATAARANRVRRWTQLREQLERGVMPLGAEILGAAVERVPNTVCLVFDGLAGEALVQALDLAGICVSSGAACSSGSREPSPTLVQMSHPQPRGALRVSFGPDTTKEDVHHLLETLPGVLQGLRLASEWDV
jgi:cysteine desulfurase